MPNTISSPNMNMPVPVVSVDPGPQWATDINTCLSILDAHDHVAGNGVLITPSAMSISSDLSFISNNAIDLRTARFSSQSTPLSGAADLGCAYVVMGDLYFNDGSANQIQITQGGGVVGSPGSISNLTSPASASYVAINNTFVWQSDAATAANMDFGAAIFRNLTASSFGVTVQPPNALASDYTITLPSIPASQKFLTLDNSGIMTASWAVDNSTLEVATNVVQVKALGITVSQIANATITAAKMATGVLPTFQSQTFTSNGTFTVPSTASLVLVYGSGGGGGGAGGAGHGTSSNGGGGGGGGAGSVPTLVPVVVTPSGTVSVVIGTGGAGGTGGGATTNGNGGTVGVASTFGTVTFPGGSGGNGGTQGSVPITAASGGNSGGFTSRSTIAASGGDGGAISGGASGAAGSAGNGTVFIGGGNAGAGGGASGGSGGGGGGSGFASGANGAAGGAVNVAGSAATSAAANSAGGGGGGGGGGGNTGTGGNGSNGGSGKVIVYWIAGV